MIVFASTNPSSQTGATHFPNPNEWTHNCLEMSHRYWKYTLKLIKNDYVQCRARKNSQINTENASITGNLFIYFVSVRRRLRIFFARTKYRYCIRNINVYLENVNMCQSFATSLSFPPKKLPNLQKRYLVKQIFFMAGMVDLVHSGNGIIVIVVTVRIVVIINIIIDVIIIISIIRIVQDGHFVIFRRISTHIFLIVIFCG